MQAADLASFVLSVAWRDSLEITKFKDRCAGRLVQRRDNWCRSQMH